MKFKRKAHRKPLTYTDRCILAGKSYMVDRNLGMDYPQSLYEAAYKVTGGNTKTEGGK